YRAQRTNQTPAVIFMTEPGSPFLDVRVRRAISMSIDRELLAEVDAGVDSYTKQGVRLDIELQSFIGAGWGGYWMNPRGKEMGEGAKYFAHDPAEAKKLLAAAGQTNLDLRLAFTNRYIDEKYVSSIGQWLLDVGIKSTLKPIDYQTVMLAPTNGILYAKGQFK